jgi:hypothetical protein
VTIRTRWDALAEELAGKLDDPAPDDGFAGIDRQTAPAPAYETTPLNEQIIEDGLRIILESRTAERKPDRTTIVAVNGAVIQTTGLSLTWSRDADAELVRLGVLSDEMIRPPTVSGSFSTTTDANLRPNDEVLVMIVQNGDLLRFVLHVTGVRWSNAKFGVTVDVVGVQVS